MRLPNPIFWMYLMVLVVGDYSFAVARTPEIQPLPSFNHSPFVQIYGLPAPQSGMVMGAGHAIVRVGTDIANSCTYFNSAAEHFLMDGETASVRLSARVGLGGQFELGISLPYISHSAGILDAMILHWHALMGLPQGRRMSLGSNHFLYQYQMEDQVYLHLDKPVTGFGDFLAFGGWQVRERSPALAVRVGLKLPTGQASLLLGSGAPDEFLMISAGTNFKLGNLALEYMVTLGGIRLGPALLFHRIQRPVVIFGNFGMGLHLWHNGLLLCQIDTHSPFYQSGAYQLGLPSAQLSAGGLIRLPHQYALQIDLSEDIAVGTAADVDLTCSIQKVF